MISKAKCRHLGTLGKPHGTRGALMLKLRNIKAEDLKQRESVFVDIDGLLVPFFLEEFKVAASDMAIIKFDDVESETKAKSFAGFEVYVNPDQIRRRKSSEGKMSDLSGYKVTDTNIGFIGVAGHIEDISNNPLLNVEHKGKNYLIPFHEDIIVEINDDKQSITITSPEGLFEL